MLFNETKILKAVKCGLDGMLQGEANVDVTKLMDLFQREVNDFIKDEMAIDVNGMVSLTDMYGEYKRKTKGIFGNIDLEDFLRILVANKVEIIARCESSGAMMVVQIMVSGLGLKGKKDKGHSIALVASGQVVSDSKGKEVHPETKK